MGKVIMSGCAAKATVPKYLLTFTYYRGTGTQTTFNFVSGMTWEDFISSKYTDGSFSIASNGTNVEHGGDGYICKYTVPTGGVKATDLIVENATYGPCE